jgi:FAD synthetase
MKIVMLFGTFDLLHLGHLALFRQARKQGDYLIAVVARDKTVLEVKHKNPQDKEKERVRKIKASGLVNKVVLGNLRDKYSSIKKYRPNIIALGYDQRFLTDDLAEKLKEFKIKAKIVRLKSYKPSIYKTSKLAK